jgi:hypothetical protein
MTVAQFCEALESNAIEVDWRYQRSNEIWPIAAQSFLIESILMSFPIPKLFLHQKTDRVSRKTVHFIVDGQQRSVAIKSFYDGELRLSSNLEFTEAAGKSYSELPDDLQDRFLSYGLGLDLFVNATDEIVRDIFRRINSYEVPLNPEEQRHARWQGDFKWYIYHLSRNLDQSFERFGTFSETQLVRMQDMKLLAEVSHAMLHGITTTNKSALDAVYRDNNDSFQHDDAFHKRITDAIAFIDSLEAIHSTGLMKSYSLYSLILAIMHVTRALPNLTDIGHGGTGLASPTDCQRRLSILAAALDNGDDRKLRPFIDASEKGTNVKLKRLTRARYFADAVSKKGGQLLPQQ